MSAAGPFKVKLPWWAIQLPAFSSLKVENESTEKDEKYEKKENESTEREEMN